MMGLPRVTLTGDAATARTSCHNPMVVDNGDGTTAVWLIGLWYDDDLVRTPDGWRIRHRRQERCYFLTGLADAPSPELPGPQQAGTWSTPDKSEGFVRVDRPRDGVAVVTLDRPERMNAMAFDVMVPLREALEAVSRDTDVRVVVLTGAGGAFCSGADLEDPGRVPDVDGLTLPTIALRSMELLDDVITTVRRMHQPVVAAVNGPAIGGGFCLALACDIRVASDDAWFRAAGITNGLTASELGISYLLPRTIGQARAAEIMLTGRDLHAVEAERIGLVARVVPAGDLLDACFETADRILGFSRPGVELTKRMLWASLDAASLQAHMDHEGVAQLFVRLTTRNFEEAVAARREKRPPHFRD
jgi:enoyl-CoA hydratase